MVSILGVQVNETSYVDATRQIVSWAIASEHRFVCAANVHLVTEAALKKEFRNSIAQADLVTPDGMPLVWWIRYKRRSRQPRVYGPDLMLTVLESAEKEGIKVGFLGSTPAVLNLLTDNIKQRYPRLDIGFSFSPSFGSVSPQQEEQLISEIRQSQVRILMVGLGCPKQEMWMSKHKEDLETVMLGVGAAFDFHAGAKPQAPRWMQRSGLEWLFRLASEPGRLWKRYLVTNTLFILLLLGQLLGLIQFDDPDSSGPGSEPKN